MIKATVVGDERINVALGNMPGNVTQSVAARLQKVLFTLEGNVKSKKLSGQALHVRTNRLRSSIHASDVMITGDNISGTVGTNVAYAAYHEYGFTGTENVREHLRKIKQSAILHMTGKRAGTINKAATSRLQGPQQICTVKAHTRKVNYPEHSFLRSQMKEDADFIKEQIALGAKEGAKL